jgi:hypothetical protein
MNKEDMEQSLLYFAEFYKNQSKLLDVDKKLAFDYTLYQGKIYFHFR